MPVPKSYAQTDKRRRLAPPDHFRLKLLRDIAFFQHQFIELRSFYSRLLRVRPPVYSPATIRVVVRYLSALEFANLRLEIARLKLIYMPRTLRLPATLQAYQAIQELVEANSNLNAYMKNVKYQAK